MSTTPRHSDFRMWSVNDRLKLVEDVWDSIVNDQQQLPVPDHHRVELDQRLESLEANPNDVISWEQVKRDLGKRA